MRNRRQFESSDQENIHSRGTRGTGEGGPRMSKPRRIVWAVLIFFFISAAAAWASELINA